MYRWNFWQCGIVNFCQVLEPYIPVHQASIYCTCKIVLQDWDNKTSFNNVRINRGRPVLSWKGTKWVLPRWGSFYFYTFVFNLGDHFWEWPVCVSGVSLHVLSCLENVPSGRYSLFHITLGNKRSTIWSCWLFTIYHEFFTVVNVSSELET